MDGGRNLVQYRLAFPEDYTTELHACFGVKGGHVSL